MQVAGDPGPGDLAEVHPHVEPLGGVFLGQGLRTQRDEGHQLPLFFPRQEKEVGDVAAARRLARTNLRVLAEAVRLGYRIVCTEPAAVTCITHDYPLLVEDEELPRVVAATRVKGARSMRIDRADGPSPMMRSSSKSSIAG